ncbi:hydroxyacylglutathione hydrolase GLO2 [Sugiyamaella lignohabitans]|uniref:Hydroxyacylglutathione hydrolase GLO2 n=1 Tax=Sugiyamaella lignohabitans TaxID=796027 RepID=A0A167CLB3_9ASCO|nr:hydroxyacylglutathione hydrolase GLO2 [Sugiyamaella lignohabitans]ANB11846.1 hydroxyacylglutathione hydrolase GLO2 [Sugiyamaella lignohabitans]
MVTALVSVLGSLPDDTKVYPGHEYTASNLKFVKTVLNNEAVSKLDKFTAQNEQTTGAFTIGDEKQYNPFMMVDSPVIKKAVGLDDRVDVMHKLRELKNKM